MKEPLHFLDDQRIVVLPGDQESTLNFIVEKWIEIAKESIEDHGFFAVALSGGSTPKLIYKKLCSNEVADQIDWSKVFLFWSDERSVGPEDPDSNYHMAMEEGGLSHLPIPSDHIFRMVAESNIEKNAAAYEKLIKKQLGPHSFDLIMLGMGDDGHTASLFPYTKGLSENKKLVVANFVEEKNTWRMTMTYPCINSARYICIYVMGKAKAKPLENVLTTPFNAEKYPSQKVGSVESPVIWIIDDEAGELLVTHLQA